MKLKIVHSSTYRYEHPVAYGLQRLRLTPKSRSGQTVHDWTIEVEGGKHEVRFEDQHCNQVDLYSIDPDSSEIRIHCEGEVETPDNHGIIGPHSGFAPLWHYRRATDLTRPGKKVAALAKEIAAPDPEIAEGDDVARMHKLLRLIAGNVAYETGHTHAATTAEEAIEAGHGVCQDHAHIFISVARKLGLPARYVSGYLMMNDRVEQDASHAWAEAHIDDIGWVGFDVSNGISPDERYVRVATGLDYRDAAPIAGIRIGSHGEELLVNVQVQQ